MVSCDITKLKQVLAPPHTVPQMEWEGTLLTDSADILKKIDEQSGSEWKLCPEGKRAVVEATEAWAGGEFPPKPKAASKKQKTQLSGSAWKLYPEDKRAAIEATEAWAGGEFNAFVLYNSWWVEEGFQASIKIREMVIPNWVPAAIADFILPYIFDVGRSRGFLRKRCRGILGEDLIPEGRDAGPDEGPGMKRALLAHIATLEGKLSGGKQWIEGTEEPSAADFALYGMMERFVGSVGDAEMGACTPWLWEESGATQLQAWHQRMVARFPIRFIGKDDECKVWSE
ncbi:hypothetical protein T484DRAFT_1764824 [Baffinella frigidus]|nr:hypothetical protein T484DRAFT_1764824 [Cryptophyta sp. CCMP2293]